MNMFLVMNALDLDPHSMQVMLFDLHPDGPYTDLIRKAYSPNHDLLRHQHYRGKKVPRTALPNALTCLLISIAPIDSLPEACLSFGIACWFDLPESC